MRVAYPGRFINKNVGGNSTYTRALYEGLNNRGIDVDIIPHSNNPAMNLLLETAYAAKSRSMCHFTGDTGSLVASRHTNVVTVHGIASRWVNVARGRTAEALWRARVRRALQLASRVITVSESSARDVEEIFDVPRDRLTVIPHGIDHNQYKLGSHGRLNKASVLYVGNLEPRKNLLRLVEAFAARPLREAHLTVVGRKAWRYEPILNAIQKTPNVTYLGYLSEREKVDHLQTCDLFVFPSLYEGFGFPILEAMACGAPVACSRSGALEEIAGPSLHLDPTSSEVMASQMASYLSNEELLAESHRLGPVWAARYNWANSVTQHINLYLELNQ